jgi:hypothetical protein
MGAFSEFQMNILVDTITFPWKITYNFGVGQKKSCEESGVSSIGLQNLLQFLEGKQTIAVK